MQAKFSEHGKVGVEMELVSKVSADAIVNALIAAGVPAYRDTYNHRTPTSWKMTTDCTVHSTSAQRSAGYVYDTLELVSPILVGARGIQQLEKVCAVLNALDVRVNTTCGLHVHHDATHLTGANWVALVKSYVKYEKSLDSLVQKSRRESNGYYCRSMLTYSYERTMERLNACSTLSELASMYQRFSKLNLRAFASHNTVEFRQHGGTINFTKIVSWISLTQGLVARAASGLALCDEPVADELESLFYLTGITADTAAYYRSRAAALAA